MMLKTIFNKFLNFYINSSTHVAISICCLQFITMIKFDLKIDINIIVFTFLSSFVAYNFVKYFGLGKKFYRSNSHALIYIYIISIFCLLFSLTFFVNFSYLEQLLILFVAIITVLYAFPFFSNKHFLDEEYNLRNIKGLKIYIIALVWCLITILLPLIDNFNFSYFILIYIIQIYIYVIVAILPFEIRDLNFDSLKLATVPQKIGINNTKLVGSLLLLLFIFFDLIWCYLDQGYNSYIFITNLIVCGLLFVMLINCTKNQSKIYSSFWVESIPILWCIMIVLIK